MSYTPKKQRYFVLFFFIFLVACVAITELLHQNLNLLRQQHAQVQAKNQLAILASNLEASVMADIYKVSTLATIIPLLSARDQSKLDMVVNQTLEKGRHITSIGIAPNDVITHVYPLQGNERAIGLNYRSSPQQWAQVQKAKEIEGIFIAGPVTLTQGGFGLIVRVPIFTDSPKNAHYWGMVSATIDFNALLEDTGIREFSQAYHVVLRGYDSSGLLGEVFFGQLQPNETVRIKERVNFPYGGWSMEVHSSSEFERGVPWYIVNVSRLVGYSILLVISIAMLVIYRLYRVANDRALHDELTHLPNRRYFMQTLNQQFEIAKRYKKRYSFALINVDLNKFKAVNDNYGHSAGDGVLIACAQRIKKSLRRSDTVARVGGDEFLILIHNPVTEANVKLLVDKLKQEVFSEPVVYGNGHIRFNASLGYAMFHPSIASPEAMLKVADEWMYADKRRS
ncbi:sensor domain-containing diguanylate cyclase [Vibrio alfacsensis]|uniref:Sensor domain-containing diguanylate cyclase n=1 Tax=Vibrio alfacsensis TaxID=1074311 RepID=A0ABM6YXN0_9VIBR|nr:diguanylate cyclase [Vibrio alfacsensis]AXY02621.1 sensor domain-containing diguanylate cyclase [Vibrio alfacsensis]